MKSDDVHGYVLGTILFSIFICNWFGWGNKSRVSKFADDIKLAPSFGNLKDCYQFSLTWINLSLSLLKGTRISIEKNCKVLQIDKSSNDFNFVPFSIRALFTKNFWGKTGLL